MTMKEVEFEIVDDQYIKICGVQYSMALFRALGFAPIGTIIEIIERSEDGTVTIKELRHFKDADRLKELQAELDQAQSVIRQASLDTFGEELSVKEFADRSSYDS